MRSEKSMSTSIDFNYPNWIKSHKFMLSSFSRKLNGTFLESLIYIQCSTFKQCKNLIMLTLSLRPAHLLFYFVFNAKLSYPNLRQFYS